MKFKANFETILEKKLLIFEKILKELNENCKKILKNCEENLENFQYVRQVEKQLMKMK